MSTKLFLKNGQDHIQWKPWNYFKQLKGRSFQRFGNQHLGIRHNTLIETIKLRICLTNNQRRLNWYKNLKIETSKTLFKFTCKEITWTKMWKLLHWNLKYRSEPSQFLPLQVLDNLKAPNIHIWYFWKYNRN